MHFLETMLYFLLAQIYICLINYDVCLKIITNIKYLHFILGQTSFVHKIIKSEDCLKIKFVSLIQQ